MKKINAQKGFTIVETLVAITVLMIAIAGPLSIASKGLTGALASRDQMIASYLAQESIEVIKNLRDNNLAAGDLWLTGFSGCNASAYCDASAIDTVTVATGGATNPYRLKLTSGNYYNHGSTGSDTPFTRYFYMADEDGRNPCGAGDAECVLTVVVEWTEGTVSYQVLSSTELLNATR
ncbi:MAG: seg [Candidatus Parcubacteria bacterium]|nr:seg [Candidatus Parcubacteria bacterium]